MQTEGQAAPRCLTLPEGSGLRTEVVDMSRLINVSDGVYEALTRMKRAKGQSYSEAIAGLLPEPAQALKKTDNWDNLLAWIRENDKKFKGGKVKLDHDKILYDDPYDGS
ncbi:MAG: hypothetical protein WC717_01560 [Candidatus Micrarchaeia archaeon]